MLLTSSRRRIFGGPLIALVLTGKSLSATKVRANDTYSEANRQFSIRNRNSQSPHKWRSAVSCSNSSLPPLVDGGYGLVCESVCKAYLLSDHLDSKEFKKSVDLPLTCHQPRRLITSDMRSRVVRRLLVDLDPYGDADPLGIFRLLMQTLHVLDPHLTRLKIIGVA